MLYLSAKSHLHFLISKFYPVRKQIISTALCRNYVRYLKTLYMDINPEFDSSAWTAKPFQPSPWLPIQSSESLTDLTLTYIPRQEFLGASAIFFDIPSLHQFANLTSLYVTPLSPPLVSFLQQTPCHLQKFGTDLWRSFVSCQRNVHRSLSPNRQRIQPI